MGYDRLGLRRPWQSGLLSEPCPDGFIVLSEGWCVTYSPEGCSGIGDRQSRSSHLADEWMTIGLDKTDCGHLRILQEVFNRVHCASRDALFVEQRQPRLRTPVDELSF